MRDKCVQILRTTGMHKKIEYLNELKTKKGNILGLLSGARMGSYHLKPTHLLHTRTIYLWGCYCTYKEGDRITRF
jgi:hypothetical protein